MKSCMHPENTTTTNLQINTSIGTITDGTSWWRPTEIGWGYEPVTNTNWGNTTTANYTIPWESVNQVTIGKHSFFIVPEDLLDRIKAAEFSVDRLKDLFAEFCERLLDLHEEMELDEAFHHSEELDAFLSEFIQNTEEDKE